MSNRTIEQANLAADLRIAHLAQIEALLDKTLSDTDCIKKFAEAARFEPYQLVSAKFVLDIISSRAYAAWCVGSAPYSLFAFLPGPEFECGCPVQAVAFRIMSFPGIPERVGPRWSPTRKILEAFSQVQIEARCNGG